MCELQYSVTGRSKLNALNRCSRRSKQHTCFDVAARDESVRVLCVPEITIARMIDEIARTDRVAHFQRREDMAVEIGAHRIREYKIALPAVQYNTVYQKEDSSSTTE